jgi:predicted PurR-regulated permease PerM
VCLTLLLVVIGVATLAVLPFTTQAETFRTDLPNRVARLKTLPVVGDHLKHTDLKGGTKRFLKRWPKQIGKDGKAVGVARSTFTGLAVVVTTLVASVFLLLKGPELADGAADQILDDLHRQRARRIGKEVLDAVAGYVVGNLLISALAALVVVISLEIMRVPFVAVLAVAMFVLDLLPLVGATLGGAVVTAAVFVLDPHPWKAIAFVIVFVIYQQVESHTLYPVVMSRTVHISSIAVFFVTLAGAQLAGILGALLAIPAGAVLNIVLRELLQERRLARTASTAEELSSARMPEATIIEPS